MRTWNQILCLWSNSSQSLAVSNVLGLRMWLPQLRGHSKPLPLITSFSFRFKGWRYKTRCISLNEIKLIHCSWEIVTEKRSLALGDEEQLLRNKKFRTMAFKRAISISKRKVLLRESFLIKTKKLRWNNQ